MALSWRLLTISRLAEKSREPICRFLSISPIRQGVVVPFKLADIGEGIRDVTVKEWFVKPGDRVSQFDNLCEVQSDKASVTITSRYDGIIKTLRHKVDSVALVGEALLDIEIEDDSVSSAEKDAENSGKNDVDQTVDTLGKDEKMDSMESMDYIPPRILTTPAVRRIAKENKVNLMDVVATGKGGRVLKEDMLVHLQKISVDPNQLTKQDVPEQTFGSVTGKTVAMKGYTKHMWKTMTQSLSIPHFVYSDECNVNRVMRCRNEVKDELGKLGVSLTLMPFFIKAASRALQQYPKLNAWLNEEDQTLRLIDNHNIGVAMDTADGLVVPNIKNVQNLSILEIAKKLNRLQELGKKTSIPLGDLTDTTFSLSNIGMVGGTYTKPVILPPQVMIGAFGRAQKMPRFDDEDNVVAVNVMAVSWSADHRVLDGVTVAEFSNLWKHYVENPQLLMIGA
ncbi:lipoamide acyltransferase component of branched-chain alpha-keto acid dehydrogenase complex, mitochondrial isoform X1 [Odontomachus brunneus]|uniref:lipoamide acyltransferase component of branched-chain alpha-keto acid dehydrogenase complex, mitochondrial isoform X1 n=1 Tax=Odontomachus brunneus TaxID=486640 RepID=UPI0013F29840|nr:lipoamide acyltransferase component of branched-chain alpha-keto acid dehydrogenase complex, mitochondrial isoform X1 [Odontomachus brunneus]